MEKRITSASALILTDLATERVAQYISAFGSAPVVAGASFASLGFFTTSTLLQLFFALLFATLIPIGAIWFLARGRLIQDANISQREERTVPFLAVLVSYLLGAVVLFLAKATPIMTGLMLCYFVNSFVMMLISLRWKISVHASGITGPFTALTFQFGPVALPLFLLAIPVSWSRLRLSSHDLSEILAGALITIPLTWFQLVTYVSLL